MEIEHGVKAFLAQIHIYDNEILFMGWKDDKQEFLAYDTDQRTFRTILEGAENEYSNSLSVANGKLLLWTEDEIIYVDIKNPRKFGTINIPKTVT